MSKHNYRECEVSGCDKCDYLVDNGFVIACDECDSPGDSDSEGWHKQKDGQIFCNHCNDLKGKGE